MTVSRDDVAGKSEYQGKTYYFCSPGCKEQFDQEPKRYALERALER
jgi:Cu+-exporting ATPase